MSKFRHFKTKCVIESYLFGGVRYVVISPNNMSDFRLCIVHYAGKIIGWKAVCLEDDKVFNKGGIKGNGAVYEVVDFSCPILHLKTNSLTAFLVGIVKRLPQCDQFFRMLFIDGQPLALKIRTFIPIQTKPFHAVKDGLCGFFGRALLVGIFDPQEKNALIMP